MALPKNTRIRNTATLVVWRSPTANEIAMIEVTTDPPQSGIAIVGKGTPFQMFGVQAESGALAVQKMVALLNQIVVTG